MKKFFSYLYRVFRWFVKIFYPKTQVLGWGNLPKKASVIVANHTQMNGPIISEIYLPDNFYTWCAGQMMEWKSVPGYAYCDFWSQKPRLSRPFYKILSYIITPLAVLIFNNARTIGVYRDRRIIKTFKQTVRKLEEGKNIVIFPEHDVKHNHIVYEFENNFIDIAKLYYKKTNGELEFVPMYIAPSIRKAYFGKPIKFDCKNNSNDERERIGKYLMDEITKMAESLPEHIVVPYRNIKRKNYPKNRREYYEKTSS